MTDFESFPAEFQYLSRGMGVQSLWRDAEEGHFSPRDWVRLAGGESIIWHDEFGVKYVVTRCDDPLDREEFLVRYETMDEKISAALDEIDRIEFEGELDAWYADSEEW
jgi:hypothetical protein